MLSPHRYLALALIPVAALCCLPTLAGKKASTPSADERARAIQALNRLTFGPRPGDIDRVLAIGVDQWIDQQLHPNSIDDRTLEAKLEGFRTLRMSPRELAENFPPPAVIRQIAEGKESLPRDPERRAIYEVQLERYREKQEKKAGDAEQSNGDMRDVAMSDAQRTELQNVAPEARFAALMKLDSEARFEFLAGLKGAARDEFFSGMSPADRETVMAMQNPQQLVSEELMEAKVLRATYSERQLQEVMTDFWMNHFNVFIGKGADHYELTSYEKEVIRPRALGKFEDLLIATAHSPAMLFYLDNWLSIGPDSDFANGIQRGPRRRFPRQVPNANGKQRPSGLNENYGRELMELHTLGVNGGYTQHDVTEVAKVFTGWTLKQPREGGGFTFDERKHEPGTKIVLGHKIKEGGEREGYEVLRMLARHPSTAKFVCNKLAMRFVADDPPPALVDRMSNTFLKKHGDIREVMQTMLQSPEFWAAQESRNKVKTPLEFMISALRATSAEVSDASVLVRQLQSLGMPLYGAQPPTGYSMKAEAWVSSSALLGRMNFAIRLASGKIKGVQIASVTVPSGEEASAEKVLALLEDELLAGNTSQQTHETISRQLNDPEVSHRKLDDPMRPPDVALIKGLLLGSPEFQKR